MTEWKPISLIPGYEEYVNYEMNADGILRRTVGGKGVKARQMLSLVTLKNGYCGYTVCCKGNPKLLYVHRAIAYLFIPNPERCDIVDHCNGDPRDNRIVNLRWCSSQQNNRNSRVRSNNIVGHKNIHKVCQRGKYWFWQIQISILGSQRKTKSFRCEPDDTEPPAEVIAKRDEMLKELHGEFARSE